MVVKVWTMNSVFHVMGSEIPSGMSYSQKDRPTGRQTDGWRERGRERERERERGHLGVLDYLCRESVISQHKCEWLTQLR